MAHIQEVMATGVTSTLARMLGSNRLRTVVAAGSIQDDATPLVSNFCLVACSLPGQGVRLGYARAAAITALFAIGPEAVSIYPAEDEAINDLPANAPLLLQPSSALMAVPSRDHWLVVLSTADGGIADAPIDGGSYIRQDGEWVELPPPLPDAPSNDVLYGRQNASWQPVVGGGGGGGVAGVTAGTGLLVNGTPGATITTVGVMALDVPVSVAHGGTGASASGGQALDNILGLGGLGFLERTGSGVYSVVADPLPVAKGGTGATAAGQALDNIAGVTGTGFLERTGGGTYTVTADPLPVNKGGTNANAPGGQALDNISGFNTTGFVQRIGAGAYSLVPSVGGVTSITATGGLAANGVAGGSITTAGNITVAAGPPGAVLGFGASGVAAPSAALAAGHLVEGGGTSTPTASATWSEDVNHSLSGNLNTGAVPGSPSTDAGLYIAGATGNAPALSGDGFGASGLRLIGRRSEGTPALPTAPTDALALTSITARGYTGSGYGTADQGAVVLTAAGNWAPGVNGTRIRFNVTPIGSTTLALAGAFEADGTLYVGPTSNTTSKNTGSGTVNVDTDYYRAGLRLGLANGMGDVTIASPAANDVLTWNSGTGKWVNSPAATGGGTVTHTAGPLTDQAVMLGNAGADAQVSATWSEDVNKTFAANFNTVIAPGSNSGEPGIYLAGPDGSAVTGLPAPSISGDGIVTPGLKLIGRRANGTLASPSAPAENQALIAMLARGYTGAAWGTVDQAGLVMSPAEAWSAGVNGTKIRTYTTPRGSTAIAQTAAFQSDGTLYVGSSTNSTANNTGPGTVNAADYYRANVKLGLVNMGDVAVGSPAANDVLTWSSGAGKWVNAPPATGGGGTVTHIAGPLTAQAMMLGGGGADAKTSATWTEDTNKTFAANFNASAAPGSNSGEVGIYIAGPNGVPGTGLPAPSVSGDGIQAPGLKLIGRRGEGTMASPSGPTDNVSLISMLARGWTGSGGAWGTSDQAGVTMSPAENWAVGANGAKIRTYTTPRGSTAIVQTAAFQSDGTLYIGGSTSSTANNTGGGTVNAGTGYFVNNVTLASIAETLTNKTISGAANTLSAIGNASLTNSSVTIAGNAVSLGGTLSAATLAASLPAMVGANGSAGVKGLVPAPSSGDAAANRYLMADGTWRAPAGAGNVSAAGTLAANQITLGSGGTGVQTLGSGGTTFQVLHGNAAGAPTFSAVSLATDVSGTLQAAQHPALAGDVTSVAGSLTTLLATVNANIGTYQGITVNAKGLVTAAVNLSYLTGNQTITISGDVAGSGTTAITATLPNINAAVGTFQGLTLNAKGQVTAAVNVNAVTHSAGALTAGAVMLGNGSADAKVSTVWVEDGNHTLAANLNAGSVPGANASDAGLYIAGANGNAPALSGDGFGASGLRLVGRRAEGTLASPSAPTDALALTSITARGYFSGAYSTIDQAAVVLTTAGNWGAGANGTRVRFNVTPQGSTTLMLAGAFESDGTLYVGATSSTTSKNTGPGTVNVDTGYFVAGVALNAVSETLTNKAIAATQLTGTLQAAQHPALAGDVTSVAGSLTTTLPNVNAAVGTFQGLVLNAKGQVTGATNQNYAPLASPALTGTPSAPTPATADNTTAIATTAFVKAQGYGTGTVTHSAGALTTQAIVLGNGSADAKVSATWVEDTNKTFAANFNATAAPGSNANEVGIYIAGPNGAAGAPAPSISGDGIVTPGLKLIGRRAEGTMAAPSGPIDNSALISMLARGWTGSGGAWGNSDQAGLTMSPAENWTTVGSNGAKVRTYTTPRGSTAIAQTAAFQSDGTLYVGSSTSSTANNTGAGTVNATDYYRANVKIGLANGMGDATITSPANNDFLTYNSGSTKWVNTPATGIAALTGAVTHSAGGLTTQAMMLGNGSADAKVSATWTEDANKVLAANFNPLTAPGSISGEPGIYLAGPDGVTPSMSGDGFGNTGLKLTGRRAQGSLATSVSPPTDALALLSLTGRGYTSSGWGTADQGAVVVTAAGNWGVGANGARVRFNITPQGSTTLTFAGAFESDGTFYVGPQSSTTSKNTGAGTVHADTGYYLNGKNVTPGTLAVTQASPTNPTGSGNTTTGLMMGCAVAITPQATSRVEVQVCGDIFNSNAVGNGARAQIRWGTGTAPVNGAAVTGTAVGSNIAHVSATTAHKAPFSLNAVISGLTPGTGIWVDLGVTATTAGTGTVENLSFTLTEL